MAERMSTASESGTVESSTPSLLIGPDNPFFRLARVNAEAASLISRYDQVTRLPNRIQFVEDFPELMGASKGAGRVLILVTLGDALQYNEISLRLGSAFAEEFTQAGAALLQALLPQHQPLYHVSPLGFAFLADAPNIERPPDIVGYIARASTRPLLCRDIPIRTRIGIGILDLRNASSDGTEALRACLAAALHSRQSPEGFSSYDGAIAAAQQRALRILGDLPAALAAEDQLSLHFQPRIAMPTGMCIGVEALLRWRHPELGLIEPAEFIPLAEQTDFMAAVTDWVLGAALSQAQVWWADDKRLEISVNVSPLNLLEEGFAEKLISRTKGQPIHSEQLVLEISETALASHLIELKGPMAALRNAGYRIAIDDFGSGQSRLQISAGLPVDMIKLDRMLVGRLGEPEPSLDLVQQIISTTQSAGLRVSAEGIESAAIYEALSGMRCDEGQGYLMARPMPASVFERWLEDL